MAPVVAPTIDAGGIMTWPVAASFRMRVHTLAVRGLLMLAGTMKGFHVTVWPVTTALTWSDVEGEGVGAMRLEIRVQLHPKTLKTGHKPAGNLSVRPGGREGP